jgi:diguanylate cyclase (GGDEF)-like protein/PAS domain S-box-containing protein
MAVLFIMLTYVAVTQNGLARPTALLFSQLREQEQEATRMRARALEELRISEEQYRTVFDQSPAGLFLFDTNMVATRCNKRLTQLLQTPEELIVGTDLRDLNEPNLAAEIESALGGDLGTYEGQLHFASSGDLWVSSRAAPLFDGDGKVSGGIGIIVDMTEGKQAEELIERLAFHDVLTDLPNRTLFRDRLRQTLGGAERDSRPVALLFIDLDRFADINHLVGQAGADTVLQMTAARLQPLIRDADTIARWGADEFVALLPDVQGLAGASRVAEQFRAALAEAWLLQGHSFAVTASIGVALFPGDGQEAEDLLQHVMIAAQRAKDGGGDSYQFYDHEMGRAVEERVKTEHELRLALEREEFVLFYQPQVDLATARMVGVEALVRWRHPTQGLLPPIAFLPVAESTGLIEELSAWVVREACTQAAAWQAAGHPPIRMAVNLSARDFKGGRVADLIVAALDESGLPAEWLEVELTETAVVADAQSTARQLEALRARGVSVALDDFGTGYSSLTHLQTLPISRVKIDRSFVSRVDDDARAAAIVGSMIALIHSLGLEAIAEGVETASDVAFLRDRGCDIGQGYLFSRPVPAEECADLQSTPSWVTGSDLEIAPAQTR